MVAVRIVVALEAGEEVLPASALLEDLLGAEDVYLLAVIKRHHRDLGCYQNRSTTTGSL